MKKELSLENDREFFVILFDSFWWLLRGTKILSAAGKLLEMTGT